MLNCPGPMLTSNRSPPLDRISCCAKEDVDGNLHNRENLEEVVLGEVLVRMIVMKLMIVSKEP